MNGLPEDVKESITLLRSNICEMSASETLIITPDNKPQITITTYAHTYIMTQYYKYVCQYCLRERADIQGR